MSEEVATYRWSRTEAIEHTRELLVIDLRDLAGREGCEFDSEPEIQVLSPLVAMERWLKVRHQAPPPPLDDWHFVLGRVVLKERERRFPTCPECSARVKNYRSAPDDSVPVSTSSFYDWNREQTQIPEWCELLPCGHIVTGRQIEVNKGVDAGFLVHER
jgi:hypothetical protein